MWTCVNWLPHQFSGSSPCQIPWLFHVFLTQALLFIKPQTGLGVLLGEYCGTIDSPSCACQLYLTVYSVNTHPKWVQKRHSIWWNEKPKAPTTLEFWPFPPTTIRHAWVWKVTSCSNSLYKYFRICRTLSRRLLTWLSETHRVNAPTAVHVVVCVDSSTKHRKIYTCLLTITI